MKLLLIRRVQSFFRTGSPRARLHRNERQPYTRTQALKRRTSQREILSLIVCLRAHRQGALQDLSALRLSLLQNDTEQGIRAFRRLCSTLLVMEQLGERVKLAAGDEHARELAIADDLRVRTNDAVLPLLAAARYDLPGAADVLRSFIEEPD